MQPRPLRIWQALSPSIPVLIGMVIAVAGCSGQSPKPAGSSVQPTASGRSAPSATPASTSKPSVAPGAPAAAAGPAIASVGDYPLPAGLGVMTPPEGDPDVALDDLTNDVYFSGVPVNELTGEPTASWSVAVYRYDLASRQATKIASTTLGAESEVYGVVATNGWVFWTEREGPKDSPTAGSITRRCQAMKADGSEVMTLTEVSSSQDADGAWYDNYPRGCSFSAGGGSASWFGLDQGRVTLNVFDTNSGKRSTYAEEPYVSGGAKINDAVLLVHGDQAGRSIKLVHVATSAATDLDLAEPADSSELRTYFALSNQVIAWSEGTESSSALRACLIDTAQSGATCSKPVDLGSWFVPFDPASGLVGVAGGYVVAVLPKGDPATTLISAQDPTQRSVVPGVAIAGIGGNRLAQVWRASPSGDSTAAPANTTYLRVTTVT